MKDRSITRGTILVIEDNYENRENIAELLEVEGYTVTTACDGAEGLELLVSELPGLVLCDVHMPRKDGFEVLLTLRQNVLTAGIPFVFLTSDSEKKEMNAALNKGANGYISKPFTAEALIETVERLVAKHEPLT
jgi:CheY-like chemotaxis protein